jgi:hypothetical protein
MDDIGFMSVRGGFSVTNPIRRTVLGVHGDRESGIGTRQVNTIGGIVGSEVDADGEDVAVAEIVVVVNAELDDWRLEVLGVESSEEDEEENEWVEPLETSDTSGETVEITGSRVIAIS